MVEMRMARYPIVPLKLFRSVPNVAAFGVSAAHAFVFISGSYYLPLYFQGVLAVSSLRSGIYLLPFIVPLSAVSAVVGLVIKKTGNYKIPMVSGMGVMAIGFGLFVDLEATENWTKIILFQLIAGIGVGPNFQSPLIALQTSVEPRDMASVTSTFAFIRQMAGAVSLVVGGAVFNNLMQKQYGELQIKLGTDLANQLSGQNAAASVALVDDLDGDRGTIAREAYYRAMRAMYILYAVVAVLGFGVSLFTRQTKLSEEHKEHRTGLKTLRSREPRPRVGEEEKTAV
jgi:hypothetical protein